MAAVTHLTPPTSAVSPIIREMTRSISEILGDTKLEPLEIELRHSRPQKNNNTARPPSAPSHISSRPPSNPVKPLSPAMSHHGDTPHTKVLDMLRPFCQPIDDFLPGGRVSGDLGPVVGQRIPVQQAPPSPNKSSSTGHTPSVNSSRQESTAPSYSRPTKRPAENLSQDKPLSPTPKRQKNSTDSHKPRKPRFSSVPSPLASPSADQRHRNPPHQPSKKSINTEKKHSDSVRSHPLSLSPGKRPRHPNHSVPNNQSAPRSVPSSKLPADLRSSRGSRRRSDHADVKHGEEDRKQSKAEDRERSSRRLHSDSSEKPRDSDGGSKGRDRDRKRDRERDGKRDREQDRVRVRENEGHRKRESNRAHREGSRDNAVRSERGSRRSRSDLDTKGRQRSDRDEVARGSSQNASHHTSSEASGKRHTPGSQPSSSCMAKTPSSPLATSKTGRIGSQGDSEYATKGSAVSQSLSRKLGRGGGSLDLGVVKANQRELHTAFLASKAKCSELFGKKEYDAYEEEARNAFRLGYDFALARETELRLSEQEFRRMSRRDRSHKKQEIISHYKYLTRSFAQPRIKELEEIDRKKSVAFFRRGVQKVYLRIFGLQRLWERDQMEWTKDTEMTLYEAIKKNRSGYPKSDKIELSVDVLQRVHKITSDYANMLSILDHAVKDLGEGYEEAGSECLIQ